MRSFKRAREHTNSANVNATAHTTQKGEAKVKTTATATMHDVHALRHAVEATPAEIVPPVVLVNERLVIGDTIPTRTVRVVDNHVLGSLCD